jgi:polyisoprenoid-binding protein YceI
MRNRLLIGVITAVVTACVQPCRSSAAETRIALSPEAGSVGIRAYRLGVFPLDGMFHRFHGWLTYDPANHADCRVELHVEVASLTMSSPAMLQRVLGPEFLDAARYPSLAFQGVCAGDGLDGRLAMHGVSRPFALALNWRHQSVNAVGRLQRGDWGMTALPILAGSTVRIDVSVHLAAPRHADP